MYEYFAGCNTHKAEHSICIINQTGEILESFSINYALNLLKEKFINYQKVFYNKNNLYY